MTTQFGDKYRAWARITKATMRIHHKPGDAMQVDWAGDTLSVYDSMTGEITPAYLFIAVLPCSCYIYAEATADLAELPCTRLRILRWCDTAPDSGQPQDRCDQEQPI